MRNAFLSLLCADVPRVSGRTVLIHDLAGLTAAQASNLDGKRHLFRVVLDSPEDSENGYILYGCVSPDAVERTSWLHTGQEPADEMTVEATLRVLHFPADGAFPAFTEYRLKNALRR